MAVICGVVPAFGRESYLSTFSEQHRKVQEGFRLPALFWDENFDVRYLISQCIAFDHLGHYENDSLNAVLHWVQRMTVSMVLCRQCSSITRVMTTLQSESVVVQLASLFRI